MKKKLFAIFFLILLFIIIFYLVFNTKAFAMEPSQDEYRSNPDNSSTSNVEEEKEYELQSIEPIISGPNRAVIEVGKSVLTQVGLVDKSDGTIKEIDDSKLKIEISNPKLVSSNSNSDIIAKSEGIITVKYTYSIDNKSYNYEEKKFIISDRFSNGDIPVISDSVVNLEKNSVEVYTIMTRGGSYDVQYPDGYNENNYYKYEWSIEDDKIAKIEKVSDTQVKLIPAANGTTKLKCIIKTADGKGGSITKTVDVTVIGEEEKEYELQSIEPIISGPNRAVIEVGKSVLTQVGLVDKSDGTIKEIDDSKLKIEISNPKLVSSNSNSDIIAKSEGIITVKYTYSIDNKSYNYEEKKFIISDRFSNGDIPVISDSVVNLEKNSVEVYTIMTRGGSYDVQYPDGYNKDTYYKYEWSIEDDNIAKIEKVSDTQVKIIPVANGTTKLKCIIKTADGKETITKVTNITVSDNSIIKNDNIQNNLQSTDSTPKLSTSKSSTLSTQDTTSPKKLPQAGIAQGIKLAIIAVGLTGIICYIRYKKIIK